MLVVSLWGTHTNGGDEHKNKSKLFSMLQGNKYHGGKKTGKGNQKYCGSGTGCSIK